MSSNGEDCFLFINDLGHTLCVDQFPQKRRRFLVGHVQTTTSDQLSYSDRLSDFRQNLNHVIHQDFVFLLGFSGSFATCLGSEQINFFLAELNDFFIISVYSSDQVEHFFLCHGTYFLSVVKFVFSFDDLIISQGFCFVKNFFYFFIYFLF